MVCRGVLEMRFDFVHLKARSAQRENIPRIIASIAKRRDQSPDWSLSKLVETTAYFSSG